MQNSLNNTQNQLVNQVNNGSENIQIHSFWLWVLIGGIFLLIGLFLYFLLWKKYKQLHPQKIFKNNITNLIAYLPDSDIKSNSHLIAGVFSSLGVSILVSFVISKLIFLFADDKSFNIHSNIVTIAAFIFAIVIALISFWTLWQTKKIEEKQGIRISNFSDLIVKMNNEMEILYNDILKSKKIASHHRFYFITKNPFFGQLSFPEDKMTDEFKQKLFKFSDLYKANIIKKKANFSYRILCSCVSDIALFHDDFFSDDEKAKTETKLSEASFNHFNDTDILIRRQKIPQYPQFAIIGNTLFEFTIQAEEPRTEIIETSIVTDRRLCSIFIETFNLLEDALDK